MVGLYDDPFAYDGPDFNTFLGQDQFASGSSPEDFHITHTPTEPHFPAAALHPLKGIPRPGQQQQYNHHPNLQPSYLSPTDPHPPNNGLHHFPRSAPTSFPTSTPHEQQQQQRQQHQQSHQPNLTVTTMGLSWPPHNTTTTTIPTPHHHQPISFDNPSPPTDPPAQQSAPTDLPTLLASLQADLRQAARDRDAARMQLSTARNELYAARQVERRLRVERDEARSQAEFLGAERVKGRGLEGRLRKERNEARMALVQVRRGKEAAGVPSAGQVGRKGNGSGNGGVGAESTEEGESPDSCMLGG